MQSRRYEVRLNKVKKTLFAYVYSDRTIESGITFDDGEIWFRRPDLQTRAEVADMLWFARGMGYPITKVRV